jgi:hypothetical protein
MLQGYSYEKLLETSKRVNWCVEDIIGPDKPMDFDKPFLPESFARTSELTFLSAGERLKLNQIRGYGYLAMFELVERCILPIIEEQKPSTPSQDVFRTPALAQFADEEVKHIELFVRFRQAFRDGFASECGFIGPSEAIGNAIRAHSPLGLALFVLGIEWATQCHYVESVRDDRDLDPQFQSLLKHHWLEESQHAKLDAMLFYELAASSSPEAIERAVDDFLNIGAFIDSGLAQQTELDIASLELAIGRTFDAGQRQRLREVQHQAMRWTFLGSAIANKGFLDALGNVSPEGRARLEAVIPAFS